MKQPTFFLFLLAIAFAACQKGNNSQPTANQYNLIPLPASLTPKTGQFQVNGDTKILLLTEDESLKNAASQLASVLIQATGTTIAPVGGSEQKDAFLFSLDPSIENDEGYQLRVTPYEVTIRAKTGAGAFYAVQTLRQLMPPDVEKTPTPSFSIPCVEITDTPRYAYRGMHLDAGRHFFGVDAVKSGQMITLMRQR